MKRKIVMLGGAGMLAAVAAGAVIASVGADGASADTAVVKQVSDDSPSVAPPPSTNAAGQTYGSILGLPHGEGPALVETYADDGKTVGYVYRTELEAAEGPNTYEEVMKWQAKHDAVVLTVYKADGKTAIGKFTADPGSPAS